jgi:hypothetical protein
LARFVVVVVEREIDQGAELEVGVVLAERDHNTMAKELMPVLLLV